jgi:hypothetical protein
VDDVQAPADAPSRPFGAIAHLERAGVGNVELDAEIVQHGAPEPLGIGHGFAEQLVVVRQVMSIDERFESAPFDVLGCRPPGNVAAEVELHARW